MGPNEYGGLLECPPRFRDETIEHVPAVEYAVVDRQVAQSAHGPHALVEPDRVIAQEFLRADLDMQRREVIETSEER
jgi:hypothetical protein